MMFQQKWMRREEPAADAHFPDTGYMVERQTSAVNRRGMVGPVGLPVS